MSRAGPVDVLSPGFQLAPDLQLVPVSGTYIRDLMQGMIGSMQELSRKHELAEQKVAKLERELGTKTSELNSALQSTVKDSAHTLEHRITALERSTGDAMGSLERRVEQALRDHDRSSSDELATLRTDLSTLNSVTTDNNRRTQDTLQTLTSRLGQLENAASRLAPASDLDRLASQVDVLSSKLNDMSQASSTAIAATQRLQDTVAHAAAAMQTRAEQVEQAADASIRETRVRVDSAIDSLEGRVVAALSQCRDDVGACKREVADVRREVEEESAGRAAAVAKALTTARDATAAVERKGDEERTRLMETIRTRFAEVATEMDAAAKASAEALAKRAAAVDEKVADVEGRLNGAEESAKARAARLEASMRGLTDQVGVVAQDVTASTTKLQAEVAALKASHDVTAEVARKAAEDGREGVAAKGGLATLTADVEALSADVRQTLPELRRDTEAAATAAAEAAATADSARADSRALRESTARELQDSRESLTSALNTKAAALEKRATAVESSVSDLNEQVAALERGAVAAEQRAVGREDALRGDINALENAVRSEVAALTRHVDSEIKSLDTRMEMEVGRVETRTADDVRDLDIRFHARADADGAVMRALESRFDEHVATTTMQLDRLTNHATAHHQELSEEVGRVTAGVNDLVNRSEQGLREAIEAQREWTQEYAETLEARVTRLASSVEQARTSRSSQEVRVKEMLEEKIASLRTTMDENDDALASRIEERATALHAAIDELARRREIALTATTTKLSDRVFEKLESDIRQIRSEQATALEGTAAAFKGQEALLERLRAQVREVAAAHGAIESLRLKDRPWEGLVENVARTVKTCEGRVNEAAAAAAEVPSLKESLDRVSTQVREHAAAHTSLDVLRLKERPWEALVEHVSKAVKGVDARVGEQANTLAEVPSLLEIVERLTGQVRELSVQQGSLEVLRLKDRPWEAAVDGVAKSVRQTEMRLSELVGGQVADALQTATGVEARLQATESAISRELSQLSGTLQAAKVAAEVAVEGVRGELAAVATQVGVDSDRGTATSARLDAMAAQVKELAGSVNTTALRISERPWEPFVQAELQRVGTSAHARITAVSDDLRRHVEETVRGVVEKSAHLGEQMRSLTAEVASANEVARSASVAAAAASRGVHAAPQYSQGGPPMGGSSGGDPSMTASMAAMDGMVGRVATLEGRAAALQEEIRAASASAVEALVADSTRGAQINQLEATVSTLRTMLHDRDRIAAAAAAAQPAVPPTPPQTVPAVRATAAADSRATSATPSTDGEGARGGKGGVSQAEVSAQVNAVVDALKQRVLRVESAVRAHQKLQEELPSIVGNVDSRCDDNASAISKLADELASLSVRVRNAESAAPASPSRSSARRGVRGGRARDMDSDEEETRDVVAASRQAAAAVGGDAVTRALEDEVAVLTAQVAEVRAAMAASGMRSREAVMVDVDNRLDAATSDMSRKVEAISRSMDANAPLMAQVADMLRGDVPPEVLSAVAGSPEVGTLVELKVRNIVESAEALASRRTAAAVAAGAAEGTTGGASVSSLDDVLAALDKFAAGKGPGPGNAVGAKGAAAKGGDGSADTSRAVKAALMLPTALGFPPDDVVGIASGRFTGDEAVSLTLAIPALATLVDRITELQEFTAAIDARVSKPGSESELAAVLGIQVVDERPSPGGSAAGVRVVAIREGGPAYAAGIQVGDVIRAYNRHKVTDRVTFKMNVRRSMPDTVAEVVVLRAGTLDLDTLHVTPEGKDSFPSTHYRAAFPSLRSGAAGSQPPASGYGAAARGRGGAGPGMSGSRR